MSEEELLAQVATVIAEEVEDTRPSDVSLEANLEEDLGIDSLSLMTIVAQLEDQLDVTIPDDALSSFTTVNDLVDYLTNLN